MKSLPSYSFLCVLVLLGFACSIFQPLPSNNTIPTSEVVQGGTEEWQTEASFVEITHENLSRLSEVFVINAGGILYSPDLTQVAAPHDGDISLLDAVTLEELVRLPIMAEENSGKRILDLEYSADGDILAAATSDGRVRLWSIPEGLLFSTLDACSGVVVADFLSIDFLPEGSNMVSSCIDGTVTLWDVKTGVVMNSFNIDNTDGSVTLLDSGKLLALTFGNQFVLEGPSGKSPTTLFYQTETGLLVSELEGFLFDVSPDQSMVSTIQGNLVRVYSLSGELMHQSEYVFEQLSVPLTVYSAEFSADSSRLIIKTDDQSTHVLDSRSGSAAYLVEPVEKLRYTGRDFLIVENVAGALEIQRIADRSVVNTLFLEKGIAADTEGDWIILNYYDDRSLLVFLSQNETSGDDVITFVNSQTGETLNSLQFPVVSDFLFRELFFSPDNRFLFFVTGVGKVFTLGVLE